MAGLHRGHRGQHPRPAGARPGRGLILRDGGRSARLDGVRVIPLLLLLLLLPIPAAAIVNAGDPLTTNAKPGPRVALLDASSAHPEKQRCSGTLIAPDRVLTAAHCVGELAQMRVVHGRVDLRNAIDGEQRRITSVWTHPDWHAGNSGAIGNDLAVLTVESPFPGVTPAKLIDSAAPVPVKGILAGWGTVTVAEAAEPEFSHVLHEAVLPVAPDVSCAGFSGFASGSTLCVGYPASDVAAGKPTAGIGDGGAGWISGGVLAGVLATTQSGGGYNLVVDLRNAKLGKR
ncbi:hypothetical protein D5S17_25890 [Pseudonocardiaceae bacterium YIM PH 21723]|nr:hypothetical protein D5S17_25890 [Pseudonocardiaceae bacterium YIM PH 21723]